ncbi:MAG: hypothetical protein F6K22_04175 [Okeania sp. SIO2F4]|uniref:hypothetical protein n=1 Tax=Okeania sp. SIO2F4 TaxID=2607790 RepID=UPI00142970B0|nr:hypothetical protein [Okeania sp. SIO2F4]NES02101.1 hypothetical protein [Okeania sp. SIO2F4]
MINLLYKYYLDLIQLNFWLIIIIEILLYTSPTLTLDVFDNLQLTLDILRVNYMSIKGHN